MDAYFGFAFSVLNLMWKGAEAWKQSFSPHDLTMENSYSMFSWENSSSSKEISSNYLSSSPDIDSAIQFQ